MGIRDKNPWKGIERLREETNIANPDKKALEIIRQQNIDISDKRIVYFYLYFPTLENAKLAESELNQLEFTVQNSLSAGGNEWLCLAEKELIPDSKILGSLRRKLGNIAQKYNGMYDGWETEIDF